jgi:lytic murein transglycosylase
MRLPFMNRMDMPAAAPSLSLQPAAGRKTWVWVLGAVCLVPTLSWAQPAALAEGFARCLAGIQADAQRDGVSKATLDAALEGVQPEMSLLELLDNQPEFRTPIWDYLAGLVDEERIQDGRAMLAQWGPTLAEIERRFGVDPATVVAVWGVESNFGRNLGRRAIIPSLATLACHGRRQAFFRGELLAALKIVHRGDVAPAQMMGSWAGAFGQTQFMPSTYLRLAVDFDGDGRRDLVNNVPDALASTANFLDKGGWRTGQPWGFEVRLPEGFDTAGTGRRNKASLAEWQSRGVRRLDGSPLANGRVPTEGVALLLPAGVRGPAFVVYRNFDVIFGYNAAESYALAIAHLADRLRGAGPWETPWPTDDAGLSRAERRELQTLLLARGHSLGEADGVLGAVSRAAIRAEQQRLGWSPDGRAGQKLLRTLRAGG